MFITDKEFFGTLDLSVLLFLSDSHWVEPLFWLYLEYFSLFQNFT